MSGYFFPLQIPPIRRLSPLSHSRPNHAPQPAAAGCPVLHPAPDKGLTQAQAAARAAAGLTNRAPQGTSKTTAQILRDNIFTFFNLVFVVLAACLFAVGSYLNAGFLGVVVCNADGCNIPERRLYISARSSACTEQLQLLDDNLCIRQLRICRKNSPPPTMR